MQEPIVKLGVAGLGRGFMLLLPTLARHPQVQLVAAADPRADAREQFVKDFSGRTYDSVEALCADPELDAVYIATPHQLHVEHVRLAAANGKHALVEKPMALSLDDCQTMIDAMEAAGKWLIVGHSHSFDSPYKLTRRLIDGGEFGRVRMINMLNFTDFLYRPRRPEELDTKQGGGVVFSQAAHQVDIVRLLGGGVVKSVRAETGQWDPARPTEGAYSVFLTFEDGAVASLTYSGYAHFDTDEFMEWSGELGQRRNSELYGEARARLAEIGSPEEEAELKGKRAYGSGLSLSQAGSDVGTHNHFGLVLVSCEGADLRPMAEGVRIYADQSRYVEPLPAPDIPRREVLDELYAAVVHNTPPLHDGKWGLATMEVCMAILDSASQHQEILLKHQVAVANA